MTDDNMRVGVCAAILHPTEMRLLWLHRSDVDAWQFCGGGVDEGESYEDALWREVHEEIGLGQEHLQLLHSSDELIPYYIPKNVSKKHFGKERIDGQKQKWFLLRAHSENLPLDFYGYHKPEFKDSCWVSYWYPLQDVVSFKSKAYTTALTEFMRVVQKTH